MLIAGRSIPAGGGLAPALLRRAAHVELDWDTRQKSRFEAMDSLGRSIGVFLPRGGPVRGGDVLVCEDGSLVVVRAKPQRVLAVTVRAGRAAFDLQRAAYHLGNRHVPLQLGEDRLQLEPDHVLAEMLLRMGLEVVALDAPFEPEAGAYGAVRGHGQGAHGGHAHDLSSGSSREHAHNHSHEHAHAHDHEHGVSHDHDHGHPQAASHRHPHDHP